MKAVSNLGGILEQVSALRSGPPERITYRLRGKLAQGGGQSIPFDSIGKVDLGEIDRRERSMNHRRRDVLCALLGGTVLTARAWTAEPQRRKVTIAVGGKAALYYLPLTLAERLGYFRDAGLDVRILDFAGGAKALQAMMGGSADVVAGGFDHVVILRARGQKLQAFVLQVATPSLALGVARRAGRGLSLAPRSEGPQDRRHGARLQHAHFRQPSAGERRASPRTTCRSSAWAPDRPR